MRTLIIFGTLLVTVSNLCAQSVKADHYLDIPGQGRTSTSGAGAFFPGNSLAAGSRRVSPSTLKLTLVSIERNDLIYGDYFVYEVLIENTGKEAVTLPWSGDRGTFVQPTNNRSMDRTKYLELV
jgi:hypothetical protein